MVHRLHIIRAMPTTAKRLIIFTDLDGCLLNKHDYDWSPAASTLEILRQRQVPVIMNSSKTVPEMTQLANELSLTDSTFVSENGSVIRWGRDAQPQAESVEVIGAARDEILPLLANLKQRFQFRSFADLGLEGVVKETQLSPTKAESALARQGTEPLLWDDTTEHRFQFEQAINDHGLTLTKGGRFWHVAGRTSKGRAMQEVSRRLLTSDEGTLLAAIGDSPIDQSMLDVADVPIGIPTKEGLGVSVSPEIGIVATQQGAAGWAEAVTVLLDRVDNSPAP